ncbi:MAG: hypothetical protein PHO12_06430 [Bacteroidales bacterium]|nr:hypothetical protein [Bacteroidales bacterium]MDD4684286.1 hypothetical protein [Bacteroidales bacterium]
MNKTFWINFLLSLLIIAMFLLQFTPELEPFKYWICFVVVVMSTIVIIVNTFNLSTKFSKANKEILKANKRIAELETERADKEKTQITY